MRLLVIGYGYLGVVYATSMAEFGHDVVGMDVNAHRVNLLGNGRVSFFEPELEGLLARNVEAGRLTFTQDLSAIKGARVHFIGVGTPRSESGATDMTYVDVATTAMLSHLGHRISGPEMVASRSTVPASTAVRLSQLIEPTGALLLWNSESLREGSAIQDTLRPDRMVYGLSENPDAAGRAQETIDAIYARILAAGTPCLVMDYATAELVKISANASLTTKVFSINAMSQVYDAAGANVTILAEVIGMDDRIRRRLLRVGVSFGEGCLPKDIRTFQARADKLGAGDALAFLVEVSRTNDIMHVGVIRTVAELPVEYTLTITVTVLGATFKPNNDDMRNSPALDLAVELSGVVERIVVYDPTAGLILAQRVNRPYEVAASTQFALEGTGLVIIGTEWCEYQDLDPVQTVGLARNRHVIDGRSCLDAQAWKAAGWSYCGIDRR